MRIDPDAETTLDSLHHTDPTLAERIENWLDRLEADHTQRAVRAHRLTRPPLWYITVAAPTGSDWAILWSLDEDIPAVWYIGPASFA